MFELDILRFVAALAVILYHLTYRLNPENDEPIFQFIDIISRYGFLGVNLFFLISGFVVLWTATGRSPSDFIITRFSRLYPIFWFSIGITIFFKWWFDDHTIDVINILGNMTMIPGYLGQEFQFIDGVYWTLQIEIKFYFLLFLLIVFKQLQKIEQWLIVWTISCILAPYIPGLSSLTLYPYGPYFIAGATMFLIWRDKLTYTKAFIILACLVMSIHEAGNMIAGWVLVQESHDLMVSITIIVILYAIMLLVALGHVKIAPNVLLFKLAIMTYPLYLLHNVVGKIIFDSLSTNKYLSLIITLALVFIISFVAVYVDKYLHRYTIKHLNKLYRSIVDRKRIWSK